MKTRFPKQTELTFLSLAYKITNFRSDFTYIHKSRARCKNSTKYIIHPLTNTTSCNKIKLTEQSEQSRETHSSCSRSVKRRPRQHSKFYLFRYINLRTLSDVSFRAQKKRFPQFLPIFLVGHRSKTWGFSNHFFSIQSSHTNANFKL